MATKSHQHPSKEIPLLPPAGPLKVSAGFGKIMRIEEWRGGRWTVSALNIYYGQRFEGYQKSLHENRYF